MDGVRVGCGILESDCFLIIEGFLISVYAYNIVILKIIYNYTDFAKIMFFINLTVILTCISYNWFFIPFPLKFLTSLTYAYVHIYNCMYMYSLLFQECV